MRKIQDAASVLLFIILLILAMVFYRERTIFLDAAYILFCLAKDGTLAIQNYRFGVFPIQAFSLAAIHAKLPVQAVMMSYSIAFILFHWTCQLMIRYVCKDRELALVHLLLQVVLVSGTFYWTPSEQFLGLSLMLVYFAYARKWSERKLGVIQYLILLLMQITLVFMHPLLLIPFGFLSVILVLQNEDWKSDPAKRWLTGLVSFGVLFVIKSVFFRHPYDVGAMSNLRHFITQFPDYIHLNSNRQFFHLLFTDYYLLPLFGLLLVTHFYRFRQWKHAVWWAVSAIAYFLIVNVSYMDGAQSFYLESHYQTLSLIFLVPLVLIVFPALPPKAATVLVVMILTLRLIHIPLNSKPFSDRVDWLDKRWEMMKEKGEFKILATEKSIPMDTVMLSWATPYEFWLISEEKGEAVRSLVIQEKEGELNWAKEERKAFVTRWGVFPYRDLPEEYFHFTDKGSYRIQP